MKIFKTLEEAFMWAFDERENFFMIKDHFSLCDEVENIRSIFAAVNKNKLEKYLLDNSYIEKIDSVYVYNQ